MTDREGRGMKAGTELRGQDRGLLSIHQFISLAYTQQPELKQAATRSPGLHASLPHLLCLPRWISKKTASEAEYLGFVPVPQYKMLVTQTMA